MSAIKIIMIALLSVTTPSAFAEILVNQSNATANAPNNPTSDQELSPQNKSILQQAVLDSMSKTKTFQDSANANQQVNGTIQIIQTISGIADELASKSGTFVGVTNNDIASQIPNHLL